MPKYTFKCQECGSAESLYLGRHVKSVTCKECGGETERQLPKLSGQVDVNEVIDGYTGVIHRPDQREIVEKRRNEYYWSVEVPRLVNSGTYSVETMLEMGWIYLDEKDHVQINDKPPHRR